MKIKKFWKFLIKKCFGSCFFFPKLWLCRCNESLKADSLARHNTTAGCPALHLTNPLAPLALLTSHRFSSPFLQCLTSSVFITSYDKLQWYRDRLGCETLLGWTLACRQSVQRACEEMYVKPGKEDKNTMQDCHSDWIPNNSCENVGERN